MLVFRVDRVKSLNHIDTVIVYGTLLCSVHCNTYHVCYTHYTSKQLATDPVVLDLVQPRGHMLVYTRVYLDPMVLELEATGCAALIIRHSKFIQIIDYLDLLDNYVLFIQSAKCLDIVLTISHNFFLDYLMPYCVLSSNVMSVVSCHAVSCHVILCCVVRFHVTLFMLSVKVCISHYVPRLCLNILGTTHMFCWSILLLINSFNMLHMLRHIVSFHVIMP